MLRARALLVPLIVVACALTPTSVHAHPADMYAQDISISLARSGLQLDWRILPGPFLADAAWAAADTDGNSYISPQEAQAWVTPFISGLGIKLDGQPVPQPRLEQVHWPAVVDVLRTGEDAVSVTLAFDWPAGFTAQHVLDLHNAHLEANTLNWFALSASDGLAFGEPAQNNGHLTFDLTIPASTFSKPSSAKATRLTSWTSGTPNLPTFTNAKLASPLSGPANAASSTASTLTGLVKNAQASPYFLLTAFLLSLALGSLHALTPGHGKVLVGAYLVGSRGRTRDAVLLGGIVTLTHTGSVIALGFVTLLASHYILPSLIVPWLELISGVLVIAFGLNLLFRRASPILVQKGAVADHGHPHPHAHAEPHAPALLRPADARPAPMSYTDLDFSVVRVVRAADHHEPQVTLRSLVALGVSGGLVPCPDAIAILLVAVALNRVPFGMLLIVAFSLGLAAVLIGIGIAMLRGVSAMRSSRLLSRSDWLTRLGAYTPVISALVVTGLGAGLTFSAWNTFKFSQMVSAGVGLPSITQGTAAVHPGTIPASRSIIYLASDSSGRDQLFVLPISKAGGGSPIQYTTEASGVSGYSLSPDGSTILYSVFDAAGGSALWSMQADGSGRRLSLDCPQAECNSPSWYPGTGKVAYERLENTSDATSIPRFSIWWLDLQTGKTQPVFQDAAFASTAPSFSPDGQWLSYISAASNTLVAFNLHDGRTHSLPLGSQAALPEAWSPDGSALLFGNTIQLGNVSSYSSSEALADPNAQAAAAEVGPLHVKTYTLATGKIADLGGAGSDTDYSAAWSPDGKWIAIDRDIPGSGASGSNNQVWLVRPDGTQAHALLYEGGAAYSGLSWSLDGRLLLYSRYTLDYASGGTGRFDVCSTDIATGQTTVLVPGGDVATFLP